MTTITLDTDFSPVTLDDVDCIRAHLMCANYEESNHNLVNLYLWQAYYPLWKCLDEHALILMGLHEGRFFIYMPLCESQYFEAAVLKAKAIFDRYRIPFVMSCYVERMKDRVLALLPGFEAISHRESADYVYDAEKLRTLSGKKLQKRRNHYNSFIKDYEGRFEYIEMNASNALDCLPFLEIWKEDSEDEFLRYEKAGTAFILKHFSLFAAKGGIIRVDGRIEAFVVGSVLSDRMIQLNIEKANTEFRGIYQVLERTFLSREFLEAEFVNKEDDIGNEQIRAAKMAYYPCDLISKFWIAKGENDDTTSIAG